MEQVLLIKLNESIVSYKEGAYAIVYPNEKGKASPIVGLIWESTDENIGYIVYSTGSPHTLIGKVDMTSKTLYFLVNSLMNDKFTLKIKDLLDYWEINDIIAKSVKTT